MGVLGLFRCGTCVFHGWQTETGEVRGKPCCGVEMDVGDLYMWVRCSMLLDKGGSMIMRMFPCSDIPCLGDEGAISWATHVQ